MHRFYSILFRFSGLLSLLTVLSFPVFGQEKSSSFRGNQLELTGKKIQFFENKAAQGSDSILNNPTSFTHLKNVYPNFGFEKYDVWFRIRLDSSLFKKGYFLRFSNPNLDEIDVYAKDETGKWKLQVASGDVREKQRMYPNRNFIVPLEKLGKFSDTLYFMVNNGGEQFHFVPSIVKQRYFEQEDAENQSYIGIYFGVIGFIIIFNLFSFFFLKDRTALWYSLYVISFGLLQISLNGFGSYYFWEGIYLSNRANPFFATTGVLFLLLFVMSYLQTKTYLPKIHTVFKICFGVVLLLVLFSILPYDWTYEVSVLGINGITLILNIAIIPVTLISMRKGLKEAGLFLLAFTVLIVSVFGFVLKNFGILPSNFFTDYGLLIGSAVESVLLSFGIVLRFKNAREETVKSLETLNKVTQEANTNLEIKVTERTKEVEHQKSQLKYKNEEILSSITYAKRIQNALLPSQMLFVNSLRKAGVWYEPKDIIAGDFYWIYPKEINGEKWIFFAVADCTGHGVPGAMLSVMCVNALDNAAFQLETANPGLLLEKTNDYLNQNLKSDEQNINDGMDISLACIQFESKQLIWSGANNPLWIWDKTEIREFTPTKKPIGKSEITLAFENHLINLEVGNRLFLFSDGYVDQFGGPKNKKFKRNQFKELIQSTNKQSVEEQIDSVKSAFINWKGNEEQVDDVCVLIMEF